MSEARSLLKEVPDLEVGIYWPNEISNYELRSKTYVRPVSLEVKHRCRKVGHIHRMPLVAIARQVSMRRSPDGKRKRGRPMDMETIRQSTGGEGERVELEREGKTSEGRATGVHW